jgi:hypothetical protein
MHGIVDQFAGKRCATHVHVGLDADDVAESVRLTEPGQFRASKAPVGQQDHFQLCGNHDPHQQQQRLLKGVAGTMAVCFLQLAQQIGIERPLKTTDATNV